MLGQDDLSGGGSNGMMDSLRRMLSSLIELVHTRAELLTTEVEEEIHRAAGLLLWALVAVVSGGFAVMMLSATVIIAFWDGYRLLAACLVTLLFTVILVTALLTLRARLKARPPLLAESLAELRRDREALGGRERD